ncbi:hypothetical protein NQ314_000124 [Rhamnusium bicolor]|uniref:Uncharacterized protein n=1 Tax=Rhamnusium bicolor TaxID=1586634 RepID=A0AAV8ZZ59_9CUCU|nr:hypothetical protein NQ314_000124 [Rhamnusium bicolor]
MAYNHLPNHIKILESYLESTIRRQWHALVGVKYRNLSNITFQFLNWCEQKRITLFASYIASKENNEADKASRQTSVETEYELNKQAYQKIIEVFGEPDIDLFATYLNAKCNKYVSWFPDSTSTAVDAFTISWHEYFYAFPPFSMISSALNKIIQNEATGILVVPAWPSQPWYPLFGSLLIQKPLIFKSNKNLLLSPSRYPHPLHRKLSLVAGKLSGSIPSKKHFRPRHPNNVCIHLRRDLETVQRLF